VEICFRNFPVHHELPFGLIFCGDDLLGLVIGHLAKACPFASVGIGAVAGSAANAPANQAVLCRMCFQLPNRKPTRPSLDQFFARGASLRAEKTHANPRPRPLKLS